MVLVQLAHRPGGPYPLDVHLVEPRPAVGPGLAYSARRPERLIDECDGLILVSSQEGLPRSILEGMSMGKIVIGSNIRGIKDLLKDSLLNPSKALPKWPMEKPGLKENEFLKPSSAKPDPEDRKSVV